MVFYQLTCVFFDFRRRGIRYLLAKFGHALVGLGAFHAQHFQVRGITLDCHGFVRFSKNGLFGKVGKYKHHRRRSLTFHFIDKSSALNLDGVDTRNETLIVVDIELSLVHIEDSPFHFEVLAVYSARYKRQHRDQGEKELLVHLYDI